MLLINSTNQIWVLVPGKLFQPGLIFESENRDYQSAVSESARLYGWVPFWPYLYLGYTYGVPNCTLLYC